MASVSLHCTGVDVNQVNRLIDLSSSGIDSWWLFFSWIESLGSDRRLLGELVTCKVIALRGAI